MHNTIAKLVRLPVGNEGAGKGQQNTLTKNLA